MESEDALKELHADPSVGLDAAEVTRRLEKYGPNAYEQAKGSTVLSMVVRQFKDMANIILLIAALLSLGLAIREGHGFIEPLVIFAIIIMNAVLSITQERGAEKALEALQSLNSPSCLVLRSGSRQDVQTDQVVPGDIIYLKTGDLIPADARLVESVSLQVDESSLTGESESVEKDALAVVDQDAPLGDRLGMVFSGCLVTAGNATAVVVATGMSTEMGKIAGYLNDAQKIKTPLQARLDRVSRSVSFLALVAAVVLLLVGLGQGEDPWAMALTAVSLAVAAVPETLQLIVTLTLTHGIQNMVEHHALIRKLPAVETLGNVSIICSDKTGTLTQNRMSIQRLWVPGQAALATEKGLPSVESAKLLQHLALASNASIEHDDQGNERIVGDATETAIVRLLQDEGQSRQKLLSTWPRVAEVPFSSARKMMTSVHSCPDGGYLVLTKGAFDRVPFAKASEAERSQRQRMHDAFANDALRVIALGSKKVDSLPQDGNFEQLESDLNFEGIIGLIDPPRKEAKEAVATARKAGIRTVMITGDHAATAAAIARQIGILEQGASVVTGQELSRMSDEDLVDNVRSYSVYARVSPEDKIRIVEAWQENGEVVAMTGDGVNDAPALKAADVGIAMGQAGTEVAKSAADMVLTDDNFATIISAVREGRNVFSNIRKVIYFLLVCNLSEVVIMLAAQLMGWGIPLTPVMLLLINVLGDGVPGLRLAQEESDERIMGRKPIGRQESFFGGGILRVISIQALAFTVVGLIAYYNGAFIHFNSGVAPSQELGATMTFLVVSFTSILHIFTVRSRISIFKRTIRDNMLLLYIALAMIGLFAVMVLIEPLGAIFGLVPLGLSDWVLVVGLSIIPTIVAELVKAWDNRNEHQQFSRRLVHHVCSGESD
jgi:calcium-translocating P-type ATPase